MTTELTPLRLAGGAQGFNWLPVFIAEEQGLFERQGLTVSYLRLGSVDKATAAVRHGEADVAITPPEGAVTEYLSGGDLRIIAANSVRLPMSLIARPEVTGIAGLRGKKIGTSSLTEGTAIYTQIMLQNGGLFYPGDYDFALVRVHTARWKALQSGEIDAAPQPAPWNFLAERDGFRNIGEVSDAIPEVVFAALVADRHWIAANTRTAAKLIGALAEAHDFVNDPAHDAVTLPVYQRITVPDDPALAARGLAYTRDMGMWPRGLRVPPAALETTADLMVRAGLVKEDDRARAAGVLDPSITAAR